MSTSYQVKGGTFFETQCTVLYTELECGPDRHTDARDHNTEYRSLADISCSALCCHSNETRASNVNGFNST